MSLEKLILNRRTIRKFTQKPILKETLLSYIDLARLSPTGANLQPLKYAVITEKETVDKIFPLTKWAGYFGGAYTPNETERPTAFILVFHDEAIPGASAEFDAGAAIMTINLLAEKDGIGCCIMGAIEREKICALLGTPEGLRLMYALALGYKGETPTFVELEGEDVKYFLKNDQIHVPKRKKNEILINF